MTRKHYKAIAEIIYHTLPLGNIPNLPPVGEKAVLSENNMFLKHLANYFAKENLHFDQDKFLRACGL